MGATGTVANRSKAPAGHPQLNWGVQRKYTPSELQTVAEGYLIPENQPWTVSEISYELGIARETFYEWLRGNYGQLSDVAKKIKSKIDLNFEKRLMQGRGNVAGMIFFAKNRMGWVDRVESTVNHTTDFFDKVNDFLSEHKDLIESKQPEVIEVKKVEQEE